MAKKKDSLYIETITKINLDFHIVRVWREAIEGNERDETSYHQLFDKVNKGRHHSDYEIQKFVDAIIKLPRVNAVEYTNDGGDGQVIYKNWP